ncbi:MAG: hypothetical protein JWO07_457 [Candidatus Saccharibacteria bacterium]|nr:hypothetical protein [Candidatus Saccharibacteria bacterium]
MTDHGHAQPKQPGSITPERIAEIVTQLPGNHDPNTEYAYPIPGTDRLGMLPLQHILRICGESIAAAPPEKVTEDLKYYREMAVNLRNAGGRELEAALYFGKRSLYQVLKRQQQA